MIETLNYIGGTWAPSESGQTGERLNPAHLSEIVARYQKSTRADIGRARHASCEAGAGIMPRNGLRAETQDRTTEDPLAVACHKLRTPLTSALGFLQLSLRQERQRSDPSNLDHLEMVDQQLRRMSAMINELAEHAGEA